jgi:putative ABC transport system ATP-binding protein
MSDPGVLSAAAPAGAMPPPAQEPLVALRDLTKYYVRGDQIVPVLVGINLDVYEGDYVALMGPSGSGKSTLLNLVAGIDKPSSGEIRVAGVDIARMSDADLARWRSANVGFIFQFYNLMPVLTAFDNVELPLLLTRLTRRDRRERVQTALALVGLTDRMDHYPNELGRAAAARGDRAGAHHQPTIVVADEPTGDLDRATAEEILGLLDRLNRDIGKTIIMVTHDPKAAGKAHRVVQLEKVCWPAESLQRAPVRLRRQLLRAIGRAVGFVGSEVERALRWPRRRVRRPGSRYA